MLKIGIPYLVKDGNQTRLCADIDRDGVTRTMWFAVESQYEKFLLVERSDAFIIGLLQYAIQYGHDIEAVAPMTRRIYENLTSQFLPCYNRIHGDFKSQKGHSVRIICPLADEIPSLCDAVGTGISCGVDSLHVFAAHKDITHACIWNMHGVTDNESEEKRRMGWDNLVKQARRFCEETKHDLLIGDTNYDRCCFPDLAFDGSTTYGNLFAIHCLQKLWSKYYVASTYSIGDFTLGMDVFADPAHYEYILFPFVSCGHMSVMMDAPELSRVEKVRDLIEYPVAKKYLNVCWDIHPDHKNGTYDCPKCMRTILNIWAWDALDDFREVFDIDYVITHPEEYIAELYRGYLQRNPYALEMKALYNAKHLPIRIKIKALCIVLKKAFKKLLRGGRTNHSKFLPRG